VLVDTSQIQFDVVEFTTFTNADPLLHLSFVLNKCNHIYFLKNQTGISVREACFSIRMVWPGV
jgi:hypothetical protein